MVVLSEFYFLSQEREGGGSGVFTLTGFARLLCLKWLCELFFEASQGAAGAMGLSGGQEWPSSKASSAPPSPGYSHSAQVLLLTSYHYFKGGVIWVLFRFSSLQFFQYL